MKITFTELEPSERLLFEEALDRHDLCFVDALAETPIDTEILSIFIGSKIDAAFLDAHPALRLIAARSTSRDHLDLAACARRGVEVRYVGSYGDHIVAEHAFALLLALTRRLREAMHLNGHHRFSYEALRGTELSGKTFGILGAGRIGRRTVPIARGFGMDVLAHDPAPDPVAAARLGFQYVSFEDLLRRSHILSLHAPLTEETFHLINARTLSLCRRGVLIINTARGRLIDTLALLEALDAGIVGGAGLDVLGEEAALRRQASHLIVDQILDSLHRGIAGGSPDRVSRIHKLMRLGELLDRPNVVFTPHTAFNCDESIKRINRETLANIERFIDGETSQHEGDAGAVHPSDELCLASHWKAPDARFSHEWHPEL